ncbi:hypothetical protein ACPPVO_04255 [Dactylosporangium sp. McL0621]|uniref:hypothetical protein n=1 Tax=Dactylosporangium sp. McL0621 TaxID=3415678 RepID=UPI003CF203CF
MTRRDRLQRQVHWIDLTASDDERERVPGPRADGEDITASSHVRILGLSIEISLRGRGDRSARAVIRAVVIGTAMGPPVVGVVACLAVGAHALITLSVFLALSALTLSDAWRTLHRPAHGGRSAPVRVDGDRRLHPPAGGRLLPAKAHPPRPPALRPRRRRRNRRRPRH